MQNVSLTFNFKRRMKNMGHGRLNMFRSLRYVFLYLRLFRFLFKDKFALRDDEVIIKFSDMPFASAMYLQFQLVPIFDLCFSIFI